MPALIPAGLLLSGLLAAPPVQPAAAPAVEQAPPTETAPTARNARKPDGADRGDDTEATEEDARRSGNKGEYGPWYVREPVSESTRPIESTPPPRFSVGGGAFCFLEDSPCKSALILAADVGAGFNAVSGDGGFDVPYTQFRVLGGVTVRPLYLAKKKWHPWGLGVLANYSIGSGTVGRADEEGIAAERDSTTAFRVGAINQLWLTRKRNGLHLDLFVGGVNSTVAKANTGRFWGTSTDLAFGFGGWGSVFASADFLDRDTRIVFGFRGHAIVAAPISGLVILGMVLGGASLGIVQEAS